LLSVIESLEHLHGQILGSVVLRRLSSETRLPQQSHPSGYFRMAEITGLYLTRLPVRLRRLSQV